MTREADQGTERPPETRGPLCEIMNTPVVFHHFYFQALSSARAHIGHKAWSWHMVLPHGATGRNKKDFLSSSITLAAGSFLH